MDTMLILAIPGVPPLIPGGIPILTVSPLEATAQAHGIITIAWSSVPTMMVLSLATNQPGTQIGHHTLLPIVGEIAQVTTAQNVLEAMMQQACGTKNVLKLKVKTNLPQKQLSMKTLSKLK
jgi:hypothetical protein